MNEQTELLREIRDSLRNIEAVLCRSDESSEAADCALIKAIHQTAGELPFTSVDLVENVEIAIARADHSDLQVAIMDAIGHLNARSLGRWIADREGQVLGSFRLVRCGKGREGVQWKIVCDSGKNPESSKSKKHFGMIRS